MNVSRLLRKHASDLAVGTTASVLGYGIASLASAGWWAWLAATLACVCLAVAVLARLLRTDQGRIMVVAALLGVAAGWALGITIGRGEPPRARVAFTEVGGEPVDSEAVPKVGRYERVEGSAIGAPDGTEITIDARWARLPGRWQLVCTAVSDGNHWRTEGPVDLKPAGVHDGPVALRCSARVRGVLAFDCTSVSIPPSEVTDANSLLPN